MADHLHLPHDAVLPRLGRGEPQASEENLARRASRIAAALDAVLIAYVGIILFGLVIAEGNTYGMIGMAIAIATTLGVSPELGGP